MATVYIKPGSGTGTGTLADPYYFDQLGTAETAAGSGGKILFTDGTYTVSAIVQLGASNVTYEALNSKEAIIDFQNNSLSALELGTSAASYAGFSLKGIVFSNIGNGTGGVSVELQIASGQSLTCDECEFLNMTPSSRGAIGSGFSSPAGAMNATFTSCVLTGSTSSADVDFFRYRLLTPAHDLTLNNCTCIFTNNSTNEFFRTTINGLVTVKNSILTQDGSGTTTLGTASTFTESNNCYFGIGESADAAKAIIVDDPLFVDFANGDYRLRPSSPCINAGTAS